MKKLKVMTVVGTRPEIIRLSRVLDTLDTSEAVEHIIVHTGQNYDYELNQIFFEDLGLRKPDYFLEAAGKTSNRNSRKYFNQNRSFIGRTKTRCVFGFRRYQFLFVCNSCKEKTYSYLPHGGRKQMF